MDRYPTIPTRPRIGLPCLPRSVHTAFQCQFVAPTVDNGIPQSSLVADVNFVSTEKTIDLAVGTVGPTLDGQKSIRFGIQPYYFSGSRTCIKLLIAPDHDWHIDPSPLLLCQRRAGEAEEKTCNKCNLFGKMHAIACQVRSTIEILYRCRCSVDWRVIALRTLSGDGAPQAVRWKKDHQEWDRTSA